MTPITKIFDDSFKKDILTLIRKGVTDMRKAIPPGAVYSASKKPPEGARIGTTKGGAQYWIPGKKDKDSKADQAKPKADSRKTKNDSDLPWQGFASNYEETDFGLDPYSASRRKKRRIGGKGKAKESLPKTGREQYTDKQRAKISNEVDISGKNLSDEVDDLVLTAYNDPDIYRQRSTPIIDNLKKKMKKGIYERSKAEKLAKYLMDDVSKKYDDSTSGHTFSPNQRREAAAHWVLQFEDGYAHGDYD